MSNGSSPPQKPRTTVGPQTAPAGASPHKVASPAAPAGAQQTEPEEQGGEKPVHTDQGQPQVQTASGVSGTTGPYSKQVPPGSAPIDRAASPGERGGINDSGQMEERMAATREFHVSIPDDPLAPVLTVKAQTEGDAERVYRDKAGIIVTRHPIKVRAV